jgi:hypothetical protein
MGSKSKSNEPVQVPAELEGSLLEQAIAIVDDSVRSTLQSRRPFIVAELRRRIGSQITASSEAQAGRDESWSDIESLSRLRGIVGGRFQNLRDRWIAAGFPLKEHRGEKSEPVDVNQEGWIELSNWIMKQGFECRLTPSKSNCLFQLRKVE